MINPCCCCLGIALIYKMLLLAVTLVEGLGGLGAISILICICYWKYRASGAGRPREATNIRGVGTVKHCFVRDFVWGFLGVLEG